MEIVVAKNIGFCFGVTRAVKLAKKILQRKGVLFTLGDLVHNPLVMDDLKKNGLVVLTRLPGQKIGDFIIRSHGLPPRILSKISSRAEIVHDATCPFVRKVQGLVKKTAGENFLIFLVGDPEHPEIRVLKELAGKKCIIVTPGKHNVRLPRTRTTKWAVFAQTTLSIDLYRDAICGILKRLPSQETRIFNTICPVSTARQEEAARLAKDVDAMLVIGGKKSSNTAKLVHIASQYNPHTFQVERFSDLIPLHLEKFGRIGIISGASTDVQCIGDVLSFLKERRTHSP